MGAKHSYEEVTADQFFEVYDGVKFEDQCGIQILDVRSPAEIQSARLAPLNKNGIKIPQHHIIHTDWLVPENVPDLVSQLDPGKTVYVLCRSGKRSGKVSEVLTKFQGGPKVYNIAGGISGSHKFDRK